MDTVIPLFIYVVVPIFGVVAFIKTHQRLGPNTTQPNLFSLKLLTTFACLGGLLLLLLTTLFGKWSGLASIGTAFLLVIAPFMMAFIAYDSYKKRINHSEKQLFKLSISYFVIFPLIILIGFIVDK